MHGLKLIVYKFLKKLYQFINKLNLRQRLMVLIVLAILIPVVLTSYTILVYSKREVQNESIVMVKNTVNQVSQSIDEMMKGQVYNFSDMLMYENKLYELLMKKRNYSDIRREKTIDEVLLYEKILPRYASTFENVNIAALYGKNGELFNLAFPVGDINEITGKVKEIVETTRKKNLILQWYPLQRNYFTSSYTDDIRERNVNIASRSIFNPETGEYVGVQIFTIYEKAIYAKYSSVKLGDTGVIFIIDKDGKLVSHGDQTKLSSGVMDKVLVKDILDKKDSEFQITENNKKVLVITKESGFNGWITVGTVPMNEIFGKPSKIFSAVFLIAFISIIVSIAFVTFIADGVVKPIRKIIRSMEEVEKGNLNVRVNLKGEYEISNLGRYFNSMIARINHLIQEEYELEKKKKEAELNVLMAQINPHFLYNTLESIVWKARSVKAFEISEMAASLGRLFRISVNRGKIIVTVGEELEHVKAYISIQKIRYGDKFDFVLNVHNEKIINYKMLKIVLQPIIENAILYGIEPSKSEGIITLDVMEDEAHLIFEIGDNGVGISEQKLKEIENGLYFNMDKDAGTDEKSEGIKQKGIGLQNVHDRIKLYFGDDYGIKISSRENEGTVITVILPIINE